MAKSLDPLAYPYRYAQLFQRVGDLGEVKITFPTAAMAHKLRFDLYGFRKAIRRNPAGFEGIAALCPTFKLQVVGSTLIIYSADATADEIHQEIDKVLSHLDGVEDRDEPTPTESLDDVLDDLPEITSDQLKR